jgi:predicted thioesterase
VRVEARLVNLEGCLFTFEVEAYDETEMVGEATHQRAAVTVAKLAERVRAKQKPSWGTTSRRLSSTRGLA